jgi:Holliday junction resolvasome RuvABC endonuclease subunit
MRVYGIDYSMTSPAICLFDGEEWSVRYLTSTERHVREYTFETILGKVNVSGDPHKELWQSQEQRFHNISEWAMACIDDVEAKVVVEDYAMGAKGKVFHIAENCGLLKYKLWSEGFKFETLAPTALKKFATGKGNADKNSMHTQFVKDTGVDLMKEMTPNAKDCVSPVSDVVDSFYLAKWAWSATHNL